MHGKLRSEAPMPTMLGIRVLREEHAAIKEAARRQGKSVSDFVRETMTEAAQRVAA